MGLLIFPLLFSACKPGTPTQDPAVIKTQAAQTVESVLSMTAMAVTPSSTATPTNTLAAATELQITETPRPTNTPLITDTPAVTNTPFINPTPAFTLPYSCDQFTFIDDITIPDGATVQPGATFVKTWRIQNLTVRDATGEIKVKLTDRDEVPASWKDRPVIIGGGKRRDDEYKGRVTPIVAVQADADDVADLFQELLRAGVHSFVGD